MGEKIILTPESPQLYGLCFIKLYLITKEQLETLGDQEAAPCCQHGKGEHEGQSRGAGDGHQPCNLELRATSVLYSHKAAPTSQACKDEMSEHIKAL